MGFYEPGICVDSFEPDRDGLAVDEPAAVVARDALEGVRCTVVVHVNKEERSHATSGR